MTKNLYGDNMLSTSILLVDDEISYVEVMTKRLKKRMFEVEGVFSGPEALEILKKKSNIDVVILDVKMPDISGIEVLKQIKAAYPLIEVVMLTGHATIEDGVEGMKLGAFDYLTKPVDLERLVEVVGEAKSKKFDHEQKISERSVANIALRRGD